MAAQHPVNIVYPIEGRNYPVVAPAAPAVDWAYVTASFSTTCSDGEPSVRWGFDEFQVGDARFVDQFSAQFTYRLSRGPHTFWVRSSCAGEGERVHFTVG